MTMTEFQTHHRFPNLLLDDLGARDPGGAGRRRLGTAAAAVVVAVVAAATAVTRAAAYAQRRQRQKQKLVRMNGLKYVMHAVEW